MPSGPYKGLRAFVFAPTPRLRFLKLPLELRQRIYKLVFPAKPPVIIKTPAKPPRRKYGWEEDKEPAPAPERRGPSALLRTNSTIFNEAREFLWTPQHFIADCMTGANSFLRDHSSYACFITQLTLRQSGSQLASHCYRLLSSATRLRHLTVTIPARERKPLRDHVQDHWQSLRIYVLAPGLSYDESLARLATVRLEIGPATLGVLDSDGKPIRVMTPQLLESCREYLKAHVKAHFML